MTWWIDYSQYIRNPDNLRLLAELFRIHLGSVIGRQVYPIVSDDPTSVRDPYTIDHNKRPAIVAIYIAIIDPKCAPQGYPASAALATEIADRKEISMEMTEPLNELIRMLNILTREWYRTNKCDGCALLSSFTRERIHLFAETLTRAAEIYKEFLDKNEIFWDKANPKYIGEICSRNFDFAFGIEYINLAAKDLKSRPIRDISRDTAMNDNDLPSLLYDTPAEIL